TAVSWPIAYTGPSASTCSCESLTTVAISRIESRRVSRPDISRSIQIRRHSLASGLFGVMRSRLLSVRRIIAQRHPSSSPYAMHPMSALSQYAVLAAMLAPAFFLTATAALLTTANARLSRVIDRVRSLLRELEEWSVD